MPPPGLRIENGLRTFPSYFPESSSHSIFLALSASCCPREAMAVLVGGGAALVLGCHLDRHTD